MPNDTINHRSNQLARAVRRAGLRPGEVAAVVCCERHGVDALVAETASRKAGASVVKLPWNAPPSEFARLHRICEVKLVLACEEGVAAWHESRCSGLIIGDGPDVLWWKLAERRESAEPLTVSGAAMAGRPGG